MEGSWWDRPCLSVSLDGATNTYLFVKRGDRRGIVEGSPARLRGCFCIESILTQDNGDPSAIPPLHKESSIGVSVRR